MGYMTDGLTFNGLRNANINRMPEFKNSKGETAHPGGDGSNWTPAQWLQAVIGELGEYANKRKKFERGDLTEEEFLECAEMELSDVIIYLDILAHQLGVDLGHAVTKTFNNKSIQVGSRVYIGDDGDWHYRSVND